MFLLVVAASAAEPAEEVVVWADPFARWNQRWFVATEVHLAAPFRLYGWNDTELELVRFQLQIVFGCQGTEELLPTLRETSCEIEDVAIVAMPRTHRPAELDLLRQLDATLSGARVQLQVSAEGRVPDIDLEGVDAPDLRTRERAEQLRQLVSRAVVPFHLGLELPVRDGMVWQEFNSRMFDMPSEHGSYGSSVVSHYLDAVGPDRFVVQSIGEATVRDAAPKEFATRTELTNGQFDFPEWHTLPVDQYRSELTGVAVIDRATGILTERVWAVSGAPTPSSPSAHMNVGWYSGGRLRMLGPDERVDLGATRVTEGPDDRPGEYPAWVPLAP
ncbi:MAG: hypothetical protein ABMA64_11280 [Myxococcota bacterium]